jgi:hypothetical protein
MNSRKLGLAGMLFLAGVAGTVHATTCYQIIDASDKTLYRASTPPFPMAGAEWNTAQSQLRARGQLLMWFDTMSCPEDFSSPLYAGDRAPRDAAAILVSRDNDTPQGIYGDSAAPGTGQTGQAAVIGVGGRGGRAVVVPAGRASTGK